MEVAGTEEKKKIFRARKTMKISDRQQLESLHTTLLTAAPGLSNPSPPPLMNGTHKDDGNKGGDKEASNISASNSPNATSPASPAPFLSLNLSPSPASSQSPKEKEENPSPPTSPFQSVTFSLKKLEDEDVKRDSLTPPINDLVTSPSTESKENHVKETDGFPEVKKKEEKQTTAEHPVVESGKESVKASSLKQEGKALKKEDGKAEKDYRADVKTKSISEEKMQVNVETKEEKTNVRNTRKPSRPSSTPPSNTVLKEEKGSTSGLKRALSEGTEKDTQMAKKEVKRPKLERGEELEAQLELKITAKAGSHHKLEKIVQQLVDERLRVLELTIFNKNFQELKDRVDKVDCATKHQTAINALQAKIARLAKKFGEANQASENKRKQEALAAATAAKTAAVGNSPQVQRTVRTPIEIKQTQTTVSSPNTAGNPALAASVSSPTSTATTALVQQAPILQLLTSTSNAASSLAGGITTQSSTGTLLLKTASGGSMMAAGQPLLIQLPLSVANGQGGTLVNFPVSSLSAAGSLGKAKSTATTTFILKPAPITTTAASGPSAACVPALQAPAGQMSPAQFSLARAVYQGGAGGITTPSAGVSVTTARTPAQSVSVAGAMSSVSSPAASGPAATGSTAPGPPQGTSLTSKTDNQATTASPSKSAAARPKGSVIDLTEDDDDVQVTGVKNATAAAPSPVQRPPPAAGVLNSAGARVSPQINQNPTASPQLTIHHRPPSDSQMKSRTPTSTQAAQGSSSALPPLPVAPAHPRLPPEAECTSPPQQPQLKLVPSQTGIVLSWSVKATDRTCAAVDSYHLYAFHQDNASSSAAQHWKKIGEVKALPLPMACTLTQFQSGSTYHFAVRAKDVHGRYGSFCEPQCTNVISSGSS